MSKKKKILLGTVACAVLFLEGLVAFTLVLPKSTEPALLCESINFLGSLSLSEKEFIEQSFVCREPLTGITILMGTWGEGKTNSVLQTTLYDDATGEELEVVKTSLSDLTEGNMDINVDFLQAHSSEQRRYRVHFTLFDVDADRYYIVWTTQDTNSLFYEHYVTLNGISQEGYYLYSSIYGKPIYIVPLFFIVFSLANVLMLVGGWLIYKNTAPQKIFLVLALGLGCLYMLVHTPYSVHDAAVHVTSTLVRANAWENGDIFNFSGFTYFPSSETVEIRASEKQEVYSGQPFAGQYCYLFETMLDKEVPGTTTISVDRVVGYTYEYIPQIVGILASRMLHLGQTTTLYLAQCLALAFYVFCGYWAIKISPFPDMFAMIALFPMTLRVAGSFSYDSFINAISLVYVALLLKMIYDNRKQVNRYCLLAAMVLGLALAPCKIIYIPLGLLVLLVPNEKWGKTWHKWAFTSGWLFAMVLLGVGLNTTGIITRQSSNVGPWGNTAYTMSTLMQQPLEAVRLMFFTSIDKVIELLSAAVGSIQYLNTPFTLNVLFMLLTCFLISAQQANSITKRQKMLFAFVIFSITSLGYMAAIEWTSVGSYYIIGMQGRYLIPVLPLVFLLTAGFFAKHPKRNHLFYIGLLAHGYCLLNIFSRFLFY